MIKFKSGNCLNVLEIVKKEPDTILLFIKDRLTWHNYYFYYGLFFLYDFLYVSFSWFKFNYTWSGTCQKPDFFVQALVKLFER